MAVATNRPSAIKNQPSADSNPPVAVVLAVPLLLAATAKNHSAQRIEFLLPTKTVEQEDLELPMAVPIPLPQNARRMPPVQPKVAITALNDQPMPHAPKVVTIGLNAQVMVATDLQQANVQRITHPLGLNAPATIENLPLSVGLLPTTEANALLMPLAPKADTIGLNAQAMAKDQPPLNALHTLHAQNDQPMPHGLKADITGLNAQALTNQKAGHFLLIDQPTSQEPKAGVPHLTEVQSQPPGMNAVVHLETVRLQKTVKETAKVVRLWQI